jgi:hypothetical protein
MEESSRKNLFERTGRTLEEWVALVRSKAPAEEKVQAAWLRSEHGITTNYAQWIVDHAAGRAGAENYKPEELVEAMFAGAKSALRPLYDRLLDIGLALGPDVTASPCATIVPLYRAHVFAQLKPSTRTRLDLGLALRDHPAGGRLIDTGGYAKKDRITHRIAISSLDDIDDEVVEWMRRAYELDA